MTVANAANQTSELEAGLDETYRSITQLTNELARAKERHEQLSLHDPLTGLPNRALLYDRMRQATEVCNRNDATLPILMMDLNRFKEVNDTLGHRAGDAILQEVAKRLEALLRRSDTVARLGGDEFVVLLPSAQDLEGALAAARKIIHELERPFCLANQSLDIGVSIGIALYPQHGPDGATVLYHADSAMYRSKRDGSGYAVFGDDELKQPLRNALLAAQLREAIENDELLLHYQPKIDLSSGQATSVEALVRWQHPEFGLLQPDQFIMAAERTGVIKPLTVAVLRMALEQLKIWHRQGLPISLAVNVSARLLNDWELPDQVLTLLLQSVIPSGRLILEITESALMLNPGRALDGIKRLAAMGVRISIDDFGSGYTSLAYLKRMPIGELKIDMSFVQNITRQIDDLAIVRSIISLGKNLGVDVIAEGVESEEVLAKLIELGCDQAQGYYLVHPMPSGEMTAWLPEHSPGVQAIPAKNREGRDLEYLKVVQPPSQVVPEPDYQAPAERAPNEQDPVGNSNTADLQHINDVMKEEITERRQAVEELLKVQQSLRNRNLELEEMAAYLACSREHAESASRAKSEFLAAMSHELRTPLNAIIGFSEMIRNETFGPIGNAKYQEYADDINASGNELLALINEILDLSRVESGADELHEEDIVIQEVVRSALNLVKDRATQAGITISSEIPDDIPMLYADKRKLKQILVNLLSNAVKFSEKGGRVSLKAWYREYSGFVFQIADTGIGMALEDIPKALARFQQIDSDLNRKFEGAGLGLPLAKALVETHSGSLDLQSEVGVGTTVTVRFPGERIVHPVSEEQTQSR